jgi:hypothetical protein
MMTDRMEDVRRPPRAPAGRSPMPHSPMPRPPARTRRRWVIIGSVAAGWLLLYIFTRSLIGATALLFLLAALGAGFVAALRLLGITRDHPWIRGAASRPWRDGQEVLQLALRHLPEVFVVTPNGALLAPNSVELRLNERDYDSLAERIDIGLVAASAAEVYAEAVTAHEARLAGYGPPEVSVICDPAVCRTMVCRTTGRRTTGRRTTGRRTTGRLPVSAAGPAAAWPAAARAAAGRRPAAGQPGARGVAVRARWDHRRGAGGTGRPGWQPGHGGRAGPQPGPAAPAAHRGLRVADPDLRRAGRPWRGGTRAAGCAHGLQGARQIHVL